MGPLVLGIGNLLMGDEGIGVFAARRLAREALPGRPEVVDGGTGGFHLLSYFTDYDPIVLIDATLDGNPPGTVRVLEPRYPSDFPRTLTAHDIGLRDVIEAATLVGHLPKIFLVTISIGGLQAVGARVSDPVYAALPTVVEHATDLLSVVASGTGFKTVGRGFRARGESPASAPRPARRPNGKARRPRIAGTI